MSKLLSKSFTKNNYAKFSKINIEPNEISINCKGEEPQFVKDLIEKIKIVDSSIISKYSEPHKFLG